MCIKRKKRKTNREGKSRDKQIWREREMYTDCEKKQKQTEI